MKRTLFGNLPDGRAVHLYTLDNGILRVNVIDWGCRVQSIVYDGRDFVCGFDTLEGYLADGSSQGAFVGRVANRIKGARFTLNGKTYQLEKNNGNNHLHGAFGHVLWDAKEADENTLVLTYHSPASEEGYPGNMNVSVTYRLEGNGIVMEYMAVADDDTPVNLTNHAYFNLGGIGSGSILGHELQINADEITLVDDELIPTGEHMKVDGTAYDFHEFHKVGERLDDKVDGYDTNFILNKKEPATVCGCDLFRAATLRSDSYSMDCYTDTPCVQVYSGNFLGEEPTFKYGVKPTRQHAICLETQYEPDAVNHGEGILRAGNTFHHTTVYTFSHR